MDCKNAASLLHPYLDGELDRATVDELESHLQHCAQCARQLASLEALRKVVREGAPRFAAPSSLRQRLERLDARQEGRGAPVRSAPQRWALAASVLAAFLLGVGSTRWYVGRVDAGAERQALVRDLLSSHLRALASANPVDVVSTSRHTVKPWFAGRIAQSPPVVDLEAEGFPLVGGRIDYVDGQRVAVLVYGHGEHLIDLYVLPAARSNGAAPVVVSGYRVEPVQVQDQRAWIVADVDAQELAKFTQALTKRND